MTTAAFELVIDYADASGHRIQWNDLLTVYSEICADQCGDPMFSLPRHWARVYAFGSRTGLVLVRGHVGDEIVGYAMGYPLPPRSGWWTGLLADVPSDLLLETGRRTFALNELMIRPRWRRRGYARALHDALLRDRPEERAALLVEPDNAPARTAYRSWGWRRLGNLRPYSGGPVYEAMLLDLGR